MFRIYRDGNGNWTTGWGPRAYVSVFGLRFGSLEYDEFDESRSLGWKANLAILAVAGLLFAGVALYQRLPAAPVRGDVYQHLVGLGADEKQAMAWIGASKGKPNWDEELRCYNAASDLTSAAACHVP